MADGRSTSSFVKTLSPRYLPRSHSDTQSSDRYLPEFLEGFRERDRDKSGHIVMRGAKIEVGTDRPIPLDEEAEAALRKTRASSENTGPATVRRTSTARSRSL